MDKLKPGFVIWFSKQFGRGPKLKESDKEYLRGLVRKGERAKVRLNEEDILEAQWTAALYAWNKRSESAGR